MDITPNFCESCGGKLNPGARFCEACGAQVAPWFPGDEAAGSPSGSAPSCPRCGGEGERPETMIRRLEAILDKENPTDEELEKHAGYEEIIEFLAEPREPSPFPFWVWVVYLFIPVFNLISIFVAPLARGLKPFLALMVLLFIGCVIWSVRYNKYVDPLPDTITLIVGVTMSLLYLISLAYSWFAAKAEIRDKLWPEYEKSLVRWPHLCCCEKCEQVYFDDRPGRASFAAAKGFLVR